jgi:Bacterial Ig-like domain
MKAARSSGQSPRCARRDNIVNATEAKSGFAISGTTTGAENGQTVTVGILNKSTVVNSYTTSVTNNGWSTNVTKTQATALADGNYTVTADVSDKAGNPAIEATRVLTVDQDIAATLRCSMAEAVAHWIAETMSYERS